MVGQKRLLQDEQEHGVCIKVETADDNTNWWPKPEKYTRSHGRTVGKIILTLAAVLLGARFVMNGTQYSKVCIASVIELSTMITKRILVPLLGLTTST